MTVHRASLVAPPGDKWTSLCLSTGMAATMSSSVLLGPRLPVGHPDSFIPFLLPPSSRCPLGPLAWVCLWTRSAADRRPSPGGVCLDCDTARRLGPLAGPVLPAVSVASFSNNQSGPVPNVTLCVGWCEPSPVTGWL